MRDSSQGGLLGAHLEGAPVLVAVPGLDQWCTTHDRGRGKCGNGALASLLGLHVHIP
jgi:hypothetical protein